MDQCLGTHLLCLVNQVFGLTRRAVQFDYRRRAKVLRAGSCETFGAKTLGLGQTTQYGPSQGQF